MDPIALYRRATLAAADVLEAVRPEQLTAPTPCTEWSVQDLVDHLTAGTSYLLAGMQGRAPEPVSGSDATQFRDGVAAVLQALAEPGALERTCTSPLGFEWPIAQAVMGTVMDVLVHTWDLARATGQAVSLDPELVGFCVSTFLPDMPERGREAGIVGPAVPVAADAPDDVRLLAAMGRRA
jgi:uncharacterized protein (TIGR03086 family)